MAYKVRLKCPIRLSLTSLCPECEWPCERAAPVLRVGQPEPHDADDDDDDGDEGDDAADDADDERVHVVRRLPARRLGQALRRPERPGLRRGRRLLVVRARYDVGLGGVGRAVVERQFIHQFRSQLTH